MAMMMMMMMMMRGIIMIQVERHIVLEFPWLERHLDWSWKRPGMVQRMMMVQVVLGIQGQRVEYRLGVQRCGHVRIVGLHRIRPFARRR